MHYTSKEIGKRNQESRHRSKAPKTAIMKIFKYCKEKINIIDEHTGESQQRHGNYTKITKWKFWIGKIQYLKWKIPWMNLTAYRTMQKRSSVHMMGRQLKWSKLKEGERCKKQTNKTKASVSCGRVSRSLTYIISNPGVEKETSICRLTLLRSSINRTNTHKTTSRHLVNKLMKTR